MKTFKQTNKRKIALAGFTLVETLVAIFIFGLGVAGFAYLFTRLWKTNSFIIEEGNTSRLVSRATDNIISQLRKARQGDDGSYPIKSGNAFDLVFFADVDNDHVTERVHYFYENNLLKQGITEPSGNPTSYPTGDQSVSIVARYIVNTTSEPIFSYYNSQYPGDAAHNPLSVPISVEDARLIEVHFYADINPARSPNNINIESFAELRNLNEYAY